MSQYDLDCSTHHDRRNQPPQPFGCAGGNLAAIDGFDGRSGALWRAQRWYDRIRPEGGARRSVHKVPFRGPPEMAVSSTTR